MTSVRYDSVYGKVSNSGNLPIEYCKCSGCGLTYTRGKTKVCVKCDNCSRILTRIGLDGRDGKERCCQCANPEWIPCATAVEENT